jgi:hypothetical protein
MNYKYLADKELNSFLKFRIIHNQKFKTYMINDKWVNEINEAYYTQIIEDLKNKITKQLKFGLKPLEYLKDILQSTENRIDQLEGYALDSFDFFESYTKSINEDFTHEKEPKSNVKFFQLYKNNKELAEKENQDLFHHLSFLEFTGNKIQSQEDFEKGMLLYAISLYLDALWELQGFIYVYLIEPEFTDFKAIEIYEKDPTSNLEQGNQRAHFNLNKKEVAHLMRTLLEEGIIIFDNADAFKNRLKMKEFIENNFTYKDPKGEKVPIKKFNREYSEACSPQSDEVSLHKGFILGLVEKLKERTNRLKN